MLDLEALACVRAEEQLQAGAWRRRDKDERKIPSIRFCQVPGCDNPLPASRCYRACDACRAAGFVASPCKGCGGRLRRKDETKKGSRRCYCQTCRAQMPQRQRGAETLRGARAVRERRLGAARRKREAA